MPKIPGLVGIATENQGWHSRHISAALAEAGMESFSFSLRDCYFATGEGGNKVVIADAPGLPECVIVRSIPPGSFEQITMRINILKFFCENGIKVVNSSEAISLCVDKADCLHRLAAAGMAVVPSWVCEDEPLARRLVAAECKDGRPMVCKPLFGAEGRDLQILTAGNEEFAENIRAEGVYVLQRFVGSVEAQEFSDFRVLVIAGEAVAAMKRRSAHWITNVAKGASVSAVPVTSAACRVAEAAAAAVGADIAGVDLLEHEGGHMVLEVNSIPSWRALQSVSSGDISARLAGHVLSCLH